MSAGVLENAESDGDRERVSMRDHWTYEADHWETGHVERVDQIGAFESHPFGDGPTRSREVIRVDLDGFGASAPASMHDPDDNVQVSYWLTPERARDLRDDLEELLEDVDRLLAEAGVSR